jgi:hypothetical protein
MNAKKEMSVFAKIVILYLKKIIKALTLKNTINYPPFLAINIKKKTNFLHMMIIINNKKELIFKECNKFPAIFL